MRRQIDRLRAIDGARGRFGGAIQITRFWRASRAVQERGLRGRPAQGSVLRPARCRRGQVRTVADGPGFREPLGTVWFYLCEGGAVLVEGGYGELAWLLCTDDPGAEVVVEGATVLVTVL